MTAIHYLSGGEYNSPSSPALLLNWQNGVTEANGQHRASFGTRVNGKGGSSDGVFAEWTWDGDSLYAVVDRFGFYALYVYINGNTVGVSTSLAALIGLGADREYDYEAIALALRLGQFVGDDTPFRRIRVLGPNGILRWTAGRAEVSGEYEIAPTPRHISRDDAIDAYIHAFRAAIVRRRPSNPDFAVPLSGGRDSRHILFELVESGFAPAFCLTYETNPEDMKVAVQICLRLGIKHVTVREPQDPFLAEVQKNWQTSFGVDEGAYPTAIVDALRRNGASEVFDGIAGDVLSAGLFLTHERLEYFESGRLRDFAQELLSTPDSVLERVLSPSFHRACPREAAIERLKRELHRHECAHNPVTSYFFWNRTRRKIAQTPYGMFSGIHGVYSPYIDNEVFDLLISLPASLIADHNLHTDAILRAYPALADIPFENKGGPVYDRDEMYARFAASFAKVALGRPIPAILNSRSLRTRLALGALKSSFGASQQWYLRQALWLHQLGTLAAAS